MRWLVLAMVACSGSHGAPIDARTDPAVCKANLEASIDRSCGSDADCVLVQSEDCCGPIMLGIHGGTQTSFPPKEQTFETCLACPPLGCAHATEDESGQPALGSASIAAICVTGRCTSMVQ
jgi:hypothetical protein